MSFSNIVLGGNLTRDPEPHNFESGTNNTKFAVAINDVRGGEEYTTFVDVVAWGKTATFIDQYFVKGKGIVVAGRLCQDNWEDKSGNKRSKLYVTANSVDFSGPKSTDNGTPAKQEKSDDIPF